jgi:drug/metabolite transporter (DMT)-like permease
LGKEVLSVIFGLGSAACWGAGDFNGGLATKRAPVYGVVVLSQLVGCVLLYVITYIFPEPIPTGINLFFGSAAGICAAFGLVALYRGLAKGQMGVVAPLAAVVALILPVVVGIIREGLPPVQHLLGFTLVFVSIWFITRGTSGTRINLVNLKLPIAAGIGFGLFFVLIDQVSEASILWPLISARAASVLILFLISIATSQEFKPGFGPTPLIVLAGVLDAGGNVFYALATRFGRLDISAVLASI